ncbi:MAG: GNAT family N-acetyltransferase [Succinivibrio sp.]|jgi:GNAT superfamily N-acetyltransferase|nr:GNAT family N-acetyltransferase [Succinivibrio sp.]
MGNYVFRKAEAGEAQKLQDLAYNALPSEFSGVLTTGEIDYMADRLFSQEVLQNNLSEGERILIASKDGTDCAFGSYLKQGPDLYLINKLYVIEGYQDQGAGSALFDEIVSAIKKEHPQRCTAELLVSHSNPQLGFYLKKGMKPVREALFDLDDLELVQQVLSLEI